MSHAYNKYCTRCLQTRRFYELDDRYVCERCRKTLYKVAQVEGLKR
ncbi:MAG: hypothetical protein ACYS99_04900 [Planctomycetota bacterium]|jgi:NADH pyrophosphatase NudC (nudix superfamily)